MRKRGVLRQYTDWIMHKVTGHHTTLKFDGYKSEPFLLSKGLNQGCLQSGYVFQFYNSDLVDVRESTVVRIVKNGFSDLTKEQKG